MYKQLLFAFCLSSAGFAVAIGQATLIDPTRPVGYHGKMHNTSANQVTMIYVSATESYAIIGGNYVRVGDTLNNNQVTKIEPTAVVLRGEKGEFVLPVVNDIKQPVRVNAGGVGN